MWLSRKTRKGGDVRVVAELSQEDRALIHGAWRGGEDGRQRAAPLIDRLRDEDLWVVCDCIDPHEPKKNPVIFVVQNGGRTGLRRSKSIEHDVNCPLHWGEASAKPLAPASQRASLGELAKAYLTRHAGNKGNSSFETIQLFQRLAEASCLNSTLPVFELKEAMKQVRSALVKTAPDVLIFSHPDWLSKGWAYREMGRVGVKHALYFGVMNASGRQTDSLFLGEDVRIAMSREPLPVLLVMGVICLERRVVMSPYWKGCVPDTFSPAKNTNAAGAARVLTTLAKEAHERYGTMVSVKTGLGMDEPDVYVDALGRQLGVIVVADDSMKSIVEARQREDKYAGDCIVDWRAKEGSRTANGDLARRFYGWLKASSSVANRS